MAGRPTKYSPEAVAKVEHAIRVGAPYRLAAAYAGVSEDSLARWRARYADFADLLARAEGAAAVTWLTTIEQASAADWRAAAWKLERRYPQEYGTAARLEVTLRQQAAAVAAELGVTVEEVLAEAERVAAAAFARGGEYGRAS